MVNEEFEQPGDFLITLRADTPEDRVWGELTEFGHVYIFPTHLGHADDYSDAELKGLARYAGVLLRPRRELDGRITLYGQGLVWHLGDSLGNGPIMASRKSYNAALLSAVVEDGFAGGILPPSLTQGNVIDTYDTFTGDFDPPTTCLEAMRSVMDAMNAHFRINPDFTVDAGRVDQTNVYTVKPTVVAVRKGWGNDPQFRGLEVRGAVTERDASRWVSRTLIVDVADDGSETIAAFEDRSPNPYYDGRGNPLVRNARVTRPSSEAIDTGSYLATELVKNDVENFQDFELSDHNTSSEDYQVGDFIYVYDPPSGFYDEANEVEYQGTVIWPLKVRVTRDSWPVQQGMGVYYRPSAAAVTSADWIDLTDWVEYE